MKFPPRRRIAFAAAGVFIGMAFGVAVDNLLLGLALSVAWGISFWMTSQS